MQSDEFIFMKTWMKTTNLVREDVSIFIHNIFENLCLSIQYQIQSLHWSGLAQGAINFGIQTRWLPFQIILRYKNSYILLLIMDSKITLLKKDVIFIAHPFQPFPKRQPTYPILIFFTCDTGYMQQLPGKYCKVPLHRVNWVKTQNKWCQSLIHLVYDCSRWKEAIRTPLLTPSKGGIQSPN